MIQYVPLRDKNSLGADCFVEHFLRLVCGNICQERAQMFSRKLHWERWGARSEEMAGGQGGFG